MTRRGRGAGGAREVYFEFYALGNAVKVSAVDAETGTEVAISGPRTTSQDELQRIALQKLERALERKAGR
jgi:hypothetical protein